MTLIGTYEAKAHFSEILRAVENGERFVITRNGKCLAELQPYQAPVTQRKRGMLRDHFSELPADFDAPLDIFSEYQ